MPDITIAVLGPKMVGKTALTLQFVQGMFPEVYDATVEDLYRRPVVEIGGQVSSFVSIVDSSWGESEKQMREPTMQTANAFILVFSTIDRESLQQLKEIYAHLVHIRSRKSQTIPLVLVGNKMDREADRQVSYETGQEFARSIKGDYFEITAMNKVQVESLFAHILEVHRRNAAAAAAAVVAQTVTAKIINHKNSKAPSNDGEEDDDDDDNDEDDECTSERKRPGGWGMSKTKKQQATAEGGAAAPAAATVPPTIAVPLDPDVAAALALANHRTRLQHFFRHHAPDKVETIDSLMACFAGQEAKMWSSLCERYGPEPERR